MPKAVQPSFAGGELSDTLGARSDLSKYAIGVSELKNWVVQRHGGITNRSGTRYIGAAPAATLGQDRDEIRLIPFEYNAEQTYVFELTNQRLRVLKDGAYVLHALVAAGRYQWTASGAGANIYYMELAGGGDPELVLPEVLYENGVAITVTVGPGNPTPGVAVYDDKDALGYSTLYVQLADLSDPDTKPDGYFTTIYTIETSILESDLPNIRYSQYADIMFLTNAPTFQRIVRTADDDWTIEAVTFSLNTGPTGVAAVYSATPTAPRGISYAVTYIDAAGRESLLSSPAAVNVDDPWTAGTWVDLTWNAVAGSDYYNVYKITNNGDYGFIGTATSATFRDDNILEDYTISPPRESLTAMDPDAVGIYQQRVFFGGNETDPQRIQATNTGTLDELSIARPLKNDDAIDITVASNQVNAVRHMLPLNQMLVFTDGAVWTMDSGSSADAIGPTSIRLSKQEYFGSSVTAAPLAIGNTALYVQRNGRIVRDVRYQFSDDAFVGNDLTVLASHLFRDRTIVDWAYQEYPDSVVWCVMSDGTLVSLTYLREHDIWAWAQHETQGNYKAVCTIASSDGGSDVYFAVDRVASPQSLGVEIMVQSSPTDAIEDTWYIDSALQYDGWNSDTGRSLTLTGGTSWEAGENLTLTATGFTPFTSGDVGDRYLLQSGEDQVPVLITAYTSSTVVTVQPERSVPASLQATATTEWANMATVLFGLDHLEGEEVTILGDGNVLSPVTVSGGSVTMSVPIAKATAGLAYTSSMTSMDLETPTQEGPSQGTRKTIRKITLRVSLTRGLWVGADDDRMLEVKWRDDEDWAEATGRYTGDKEINIDTVTENEARVIVQQRDPLPATLLGYVAEINIGR